MKTVQVESYAGYRADERPVLLRLEQEGAIASEWGASENNRKAKYYSITRAGRKQLVAEAENWQRVSSTIGRLLGLGTRS